MARFDGADNHPSPESPDISWPNASTASRAATRPSWWTRSNLRRRGRSKCIDGSKSTRPADTLIARSFTVRFSHLICVRHSIKSLHSASNPRPAGVN